MLLEQIGWIAGGSRFVARFMTIYLRNEILRLLAHLPLNTFKPKTIGKILKNIERRLVPRHGTVVPHK